MVLREQSVDANPSAISERGGRSQVRVPRGSAKEPSRTPLQDSCLIESTQPLDEGLHRRIVGQDDAIEALVCAYARCLSGLRDTSRPLLTALLLGPTGVGKTETARAVAEVVLGSDSAFVRVDCEEYAHSHQIAKLLGSPPGYVGHDIEPLLSQHRVDKGYRERLEDLRPWRRAEALATADGSEPRPSKAVAAVPRPECRSVVLFDEIEKAHPIVWNALLGILEEGKLSLGDNSVTNFTESIILLTSNVGSREMSRVLERRQPGFGRIDGSAPAVSWEEIRGAVMTAARATFPFELLNRFDDILVYRPLGREQLLGIFDKFLTEIHNRAVHQAGVPLLIKVSDQARALIVDAGTDLRFGARPLRRTLEKMLVDPLSRFIAAERLLPGDVVEVEREAERLLFFRSRGRRQEFVA